MCFFWLSYNIRLFILIVSSCRTWSTEIILMNLQLYLLSLSAILYMPVDILYMFWACILAYMHYIIFKTKRNFLWKISPSYYISPKIMFLFSDGYPKYCQWMKEREDVSIDSHSVDNASSNYASQWHSGKQGFSRKSRSFFLVSESSYMLQFACHKLGSHF